MQARRGPSNCIDASLPLQSLAGLALKVFVTVRNKKRVHNLPNMPLLAGRLHSGVLGHPCVSARAQCGVVPGSLHGVESMA